MDQILTIGLPFDENDGYISVPISTAITAEYANVFKSACQIDSQR